MACFFLSLSYKNLKISLDPVLQSNKRKIESAKEKEKLQGFTQKVIRMDKAGQTASTASTSNNNEGSYKVFNDAVHGLIELHPLCVRIINTPQFQRLKGIKQLSVANYVYPGACGTRFEHSLGVCYLARQMVDALMRNEKIWNRNKKIEISGKEKLMIEIAGLCHDLGHGPFSHTWEDVVKKWNPHWNHEEMSGKMLRHLIEQNQLAGEFGKYGLNITDDINTIINIIKGDSENKTTNKFLYEIVSNEKNEIDVDKWDYFLRDCLHLNLQITFEYKRLLKSCAIVEKEGVYHIGFRDKNLLDLYEMYSCRAALYYKAYQHKVVTNIKLMLVDAFQEAGDKFKVYENNNKKIYLKDAHEDVDIFSSLTDHIQYNIQYSDDQELKVSKEILINIDKRNLYTFLGRKKVVWKKLEGEKKKIEEIFNQLPKRKECMLSICKIFLYKSNQEDLLNNVCFYKKSINTEPLYTTWENVKRSVCYIPFELDCSSAELMVFCKTMSRDHKTEHNDFIREAGLD